MEKPKGTPVQAADGRPKEKPPEEIQTTAIPAPETVADSVREIEAVIVPEMELPSVASDQDRNGEEDSFTYSYQEVSTRPLSFDGPEIPEEDFLLDDLLITGQDNTPPADSLYTIELSGSPSRKLLETPELYLDLSDPVLGTLQNCRISFSVSEEGLVREIQMIPPGTGSATYDEILENIISRFLFSPGDRDSGVIGINFSKYYGESVD